MRKFFFVIAVFLAEYCYAQPAENIIIVTTDGLRWQEVFKGMDSALANNKTYNQGDSSYIFSKYWNNDEKERRKKLFPFLWTVLEQSGQLYGNRSLGNKVDNANPYKFSYPGYSEIMTGFVDTAINSNDYPPNPNITVLEFLSSQKKLKNKVAAFGAWNAFDRILNEKRSQVPVISAFDKSGGDRPTAQQQLINQMLADSHKPWLEDECLDVFTHYAAMEELKKSKPAVLYIAYGETDEWAHSGQYRHYLDAAHQVDAWLHQLWNYVQSDARFRGKTALFITTDHGRGDKIKKEWTSHGKTITGAEEIWFATMGQGTLGGGEMKSAVQLYQKQFAQTFARLLGYTFTTTHPVAEEIKSVLK